MRVMEIRKSGLAIPFISSTMVLLCLVSQAAFADPVAALGTMIGDGEASLSFRYRFEDVQQENALEDATASTLRNRLSFQTATVNGLNAMLEADNIITLGADEYDSFQLDRYRGSHSVIADPVGTGINQAFIRYAFDDTSSGTLGRQRINHGNQRFIGGVGWRQNEQTFDAVSYRYEAGNISADYSYLWNVNRVFEGSRDSIQETDFDSDSHAAFGSSVQSWGTVSAFVYALDFANATTASSVSYGLSYSGKFQPLSISLSYAQQQDYGDNPVDYSADYLSLEASLPVSRFQLLLGYEILGSDDGIAGFSTPLATLHKFQGFADVFPATPADGMEDLYISAGTGIGDVSFAVAWHDFQANEGGADYGTETDLTVAYKFSESMNAELKYAAYDSNGFAVDTDKFWFTFNMAF